MTKKKTSVKGEVAIPVKKIAPIVSEKKKKVAVPVKKIMTTVSKEKSVVVPPESVVPEKRVSKELGMYKEQQTILTSTNLSNEEKAKLLCELFPGSDPVQLFELMKGHDLHPYPQGWYKWVDTFWKYIEGAPE